SGQFYGQYDRRTDFLHLAGEETGDTRGVKCLNCPITKGKKAELRLIKLLRLYILKTSCIIAKIIHQEALPAVST
ncbi:MAG: hypothetical protein OXB88_10715, partial [Bacteriovoracales bacterium]|nr:hypothetical protein [Bacteriovoracales bacterium]